MHVYSSGTEAISFALAGNSQGLVKMMQFRVTPLWNNRSLRYIFELAKTQDETLQSVLPHANARRHMPSENVIRSELAPDDFAAVVLCVS